MRSLTSASEGISAAEQNVLEATINKPYSPTKSQLSRLAARTYASTSEFQETVDSLKRQLQSLDSKWRCYFKALVVIEYLLHLGSERCVEWAMENLDSIRVFESFVHVNGNARFKVQYAARLVVFLLSDMTRLRSERGEGKSWTFRIPQIHASEASFTPIPSIPLAANWEPGAAEEVEGCIPEYHRFRQGPLTEEHLESLPHAFDRILSPMPAEAASIATRKNGSAAELLSQEPSATSRMTKSLHPGEISPQLPSGPSRQSTNPALQKDLSQPVSLTLPSPSVAPVISGTSIPLATVATSIDNKLGDYFSPIECHDTMFTDIRCQDIARLLRESGKLSWSRVPRLYIILRIIGQLQILDSFIDEGISDLLLPLALTSLPHALSLGCHQEFMAIQRLVLTNALDLEKNSKRHTHFTRDNPFPWEVKGELGKGGHGFVDKVLNPLSGREFARKRFRRRKDLRDAEIQSFVNEINILKRLNHIHCVELISSYTDPKYVSIIMSPVADYDLYRFYQLVTAEETSLLRSFFGCLAGALNFLHEAKIRHRDIKPQNILVKGPHIYLTDFGISLNWENLSRSTTTKDTAKTQRYCAPEVARYEKRNSSADVWSLGCVFVEMLTRIKGRTIEEQRNFFRQHNDSDNGWFYENISATHQWIQQLQQVDSSRAADSFIADCILRLLKENPAERMRAVELYDRISKYQDLGRREENPLCGECCVSDTLSVSDSGSDGDPLAGTSEP